MTSTTYLAASVEAARIRRMEEGNEFFYHASQSEKRAYEVSEALAHWSPQLTAHHLGADKFVVLVEPASATDFTAAHQLKNVPGFQSRVLNPLTCFVRCQISEGSSPERYVLEEIALAFLPF